MVVTLEEMLPHLRPGGILIIEDIHGRNHNFDSYVSGLAKELNVLDKDRQVDGKAPPTNFQKHIYAIHRYPYMMVIEKTAEPVEYFKAPKHGTEWQPFFDGNHTQAKGTPSSGASK